MEPFEWAVTRAVKFLDIERAVSRVADHVALLGGQEPPNGKCFTWNTPTQLPWGNRRYLWIGRKCFT